MTQGAVRPTQIPVSGRMYGILSGAWVAQMVNAVAELGVADALSDDKPASAEELAIATGADPDKLHRVLRALTTVGVFAAAPEGRFVHTDLSLVLRRYHPMSMRNAVLTACADWQRRSWSGLTDSVRSGRSAFYDVFGKDMWSYFAEDAPDAEIVFQEAHTELAAITDKPLAAALDIADATTVVDVGGGHGNFLAAVVDRNPHVEAVLFETPGRCAASLRIRRPLAAWSDSRSSLATSAKRSTVPPTSTCSNSSSARLATTWPVGYCVTVRRAPNPVQESWSSTASSPTAPGRYRRSCWMYRCSYCTQTAACVPSVNSATFSRALG
jgi:hypothetical protein